jgi:hypothetical protein
METVIKQTVGRIHYDCYFTGPTDKTADPLKIPDVNFMTGSPLPRYRRNNYYHHMVNPIVVESDFAHVFM